MLTHVDSSPKGNADDDGDAAAAADAVADTAAAPLAAQSAAASTTTTMTASASSLATSTSSASLDIADELTSSDAGVHLTQLSDVQCAQHDRASLRRVSVSAAMPVSDHAPTTASVVVVMRELASRVVASLSAPSKAVLALRYNAAVDAASASAQPVWLCIERLLVFRVYVPMPSLDVARQWLHAYVSTLRARARVCVCLIAIATQHFMLGIRDACYG
jgi:hypothetical protein